MKRATNTTNKLIMPVRSHESGGGFLSPQAMEEYDRLKKNIIGLTPQTDRRVLLFTSSTEGEGNSFTVANFGVFLASAGEQPLLVDANLRNPVLHEVFEVEKSPGMAELLSGKKALEHVIRQTNFPNLRVVPAGNLPDNPFSLLSDPKTESVFQQMRMEADWVLIDTPAVNLFNDAVTLSSGTDGVVLVIRAEKTRWEVARHARQRLETGRAHILGVVLNDRKLHIPEWIYGRL